MNYSILYFQVNKELAYARLRENKRHDLLGRMQQQSYKVNTHTHIYIYVNIYYGISTGHLTFKVKMNWAKGVGFKKTMKKVMKLWFRLLKLLLEGAVKKKIDIFYYFKLPLYFVEKLFGKIQYMFNIEGFVLLFHCVYFVISGYSKKERKFCPNSLFGFAKAKTSNERCQL